MQTHAPDAPLVVLSQSEGKTKRNQQVIREFTEHLNRGDRESAVMLFAEDGKNHGRPVGRAGVRRVLEDIHTTFPTGLPKGIQ